MSPCGSKISNLRFVQSKFDKDFNVAVKAVQKKCQVKDDEHIISEEEELDPKFDQ